MINTAGLIRMRHENLRAAFGGLDVVAISQPGLYMQIGFSELIAQWHP